MSDEKNNNLQNAILGLTSFFSAVLAIFVMYYIFAIIALTTGLVGLKNKESKPMCIVSIIIVCFTFVLKIVNVLTTSGSLPDWLVNGMF